VSDGREDAFDRIGRAQVFPMLGRKVVEGDRHPPSIASMSYAVQKCRSQLRKVRLPLPERGAAIMSPRVIARYPSGHSPAPATPAVTVAVTAVTVTRLPRLRAVTGYSRLQRLQCG